MWTGHNRSSTEDRPEIRKENRQSTAICQAQRKRSEGLLVQRCANRIPLHSVPLLMGNGSNLMPLLHLLAPGLEPAPLAVAFGPVDCPRGTSGGARWIAATEVALARLVRAGKCEDRAVRTRNGAQMTAHAHLAQHNLCARSRIDGDGVHWAGHHAPGFIALKTRVRCIARFLIKNIDPDDRPRWLKRAGLHPRACQLTLHASGTFIGNDLQSSAHERARLNDVSVLVSVLC